MRHSCDGGRAAARRRVGARLHARKGGRRDAMTVKQTRDADFPNQDIKTLVLASLPPASPGSALPLLPLPSVRNLGSSARRPHPRWLLYPWPGKNAESKSNHKLDKNVQFYSKVKDAVACLSAQKSITKAHFLGLKRNLIPQATPISFVELILTIIKFLSGGCWISNMGSLCDKPEEGN
ncbi:uncharacterized protein LOC130944407 [Arachis stenosperma]|uniref:uncharacterized protein LOC130944407 n=1 Tax=Arachis stenosperma TaxID=217475 RepID=UPI0025ACC0D2|nr:uncharacterized protein LOC130944407 [Arachis stenosperma]